jgi:GT2 family glycosyltransferase
MFEEIPMSITISLVSCNQVRDLRRLLPTLAPAAGLADARIMLVENLCTDNTVEYVRSTYPDIPITHNPHITGYGGNHNINLGKAQSKYFVIMNSDMEVEPEVFDRLSSFMEEHEDIGIVSPRVLNDDGTIQGLNKRYPTILDLLLRRFCPGPLKQMAQKRLDRYEMRDVGYDTMYDVEFLSGAFMFCRTDLLKQIGGFDEDFFLYFEDVDLCRRVQETHRTTYYPHVSVTHYWKRSSHTNWRFTWYFIQSAWLYFRKWGVAVY